MLRLVLLALAIAVASPAQAQLSDDKKSFLFQMYLKVSDKRVTVEVESPAGKMEKFTGDQPEKIRDALDAAEHYIETMVLEKSKLIRVVFRLKPQGEDA